MTGALVAICALAALACSRPVQPARTSPDQPVFAAEAAAEKRQRLRRCSDAWGLLAPGAAQLCRGKKEGIALLGLGALELGTALHQGSEVGFEHARAAVPLLMFQDLWIYGNIEPLIDRALARRARFTPQDTLVDMVSAPFNVSVLKRPEVWAGTLGLLAVGIGATFLFDGDSIDRDNLGDDANLFGRTFDRRLGYPLGIGTGVGLFAHVAIAEEVLFRGFLQSGLARRLGPLQGWIWASLAFGLTHSLNAFALPEDQRTRYLLFAVPVITALGSYMGYAYHRADYSLSVPIAVHFWYDLLLSSTFFIIDPQNSPISASISFSF